jgi:hypothetical protein
MWERIAAWYSKREPAFKVLSYSAGALIFVFAVLTFAKTYFSPANPGPAQPNLEIGIEEM